jgi:hypothetical protein
MLMQDGVVFALFNHQGGPRGGDEVRVPNWWMGMASRDLGAGRLTLTGMFSLDPATVGKRGYREIFQVGEAVDGQPLIDRQHPHDLFMQLGAVWRVPLSERTAFTIAGAPAGEPALGPVAFMHRASAAENPMAPLGHHTFDSTHIAFGVITAGLDRGPFAIEASLFNAREPDQHRWDFDFGPLDSVSGRIWYQPRPGFELQVSTGYLTDPEELEPGNVVRTTASAGWTKTSGQDLSGLTVGYGVNATDHGTRHAFFGEGTHRKGTTAVYSRFEVVQVETELLLHGSTTGHEHDASVRDPVSALTTGVTRDLVTWRGVETAVGTAVTFYWVPEALKATHSSRPVSFQVFLRVRPPAPMGRMWNMRMTRPFHH